MATRFIITGIVLVLVAACGQTEFVSPVITPLPAALPPPTYTPPPSPLATPTVTPDLTATPQPTWTPSPTFTPTSLPTIVPPIHTPVAGQLPRITYDLLFLGKYSLMRWNHRTGQIEALVTAEAGQGRGWQYDHKVAWGAGPGGPGGGGIGSFSVSADGQKVAFVRLTPAGVNAYLSEVALLDMRTGQITVLVPAQGRGVSGMMLSPDGNWVAYMLPDALPGAALPPLGRGSGLAVPIARPLAGGGPTSGTIYAVRTSAPYDRIEVGYCAEQVTEAVRLECGGFLWAPNSQTIAWNDAHGIWIAELGRPGQLLVPHDPYGLGGRLFRLSNWSPHGRYALVVAGIYNTDAGSYGVMDTQTGRMADLLPISLGPGPRITWMQDGRLLITRPGDRLSGTQPAAEIWSVDAGRDPMLSREMEFSFGVGAENFPTSPTQLNDGRLAFALLNENNINYIERGLYIVDLNDLTPRKVNGLPPAQDDRLLMDALWPPDGTGAIVQDWSFSERMLWYVPTDGSPLIDLRPVMDEGDFQACCFVWTR